MKEETNGPSEPKPDSRTTNAEKESSNGKETGSDDEQSFRERVAQLPIVFLLSQLRPKTSPFFFIALSGMTALFASTHEDFENRWHWYLVVLSVFITLIITTRLLFEAEWDYSKAQKRHQLRMARVFGVSLALFCLVLVSVQTDEDDVFFLANLIACTLQSTVFLLYSYARNPDEALSVNYTQISLTTSFYLLGFATTVVIFTEPKALESIPVEAWRLEFVAWGLFVLWFYCLQFWARHLQDLIRINFSISMKRDDYGSSGSR